MKKKNTDSKGRHTGATAAGRSILRGLHEIEDALESGTPMEEIFAVHKYEIPDPSSYGAKEVKSLRARLGISQSLFAALVGASTVLVQKWEQGQRNPDGMARRLMDYISADPEAFLHLLAGSPRKKAG